MASNFLMSPIQYGVGGDTIGSAASMGYTNPGFTSPLRNPYATSAIAMPTGMNAVGGLGNQRSLSNPWQLLAREGNALGWKNQIRPGTPQYNPNQQYNQGQITGYNQGMGFRDFRASGMDQGLSDIPSYINQAPTQQMWQPWNGLESSSMTGATGSLGGNMLSQSPSLVGVSATKQSLPGIASSQSSWASNPATYGEGLNAGTLSPTGWNQSTVTPYASGQSSYTMQKNSNPLSQGLRSL